MKKILVLGILIATLFSTTSCVSKNIAVSGYEVKLKDQEQGFENNTDALNELSIEFPPYTINGHVDNSLNENAKTYNSNLLPLNKLSQNYTYELAKDSRNVVISPDELIYNLEEINNFMTHTQLGIKDYIRIASFNEDGIPIIMDLEYDGFVITLYIDKSRLADGKYEIEKIIYDSITLQIEYDNDLEQNLIRYILSSKDIDHKRVLFQIPESNF